MTVHVQLLSAFIRKADVAAHYPGGCETFEQQHALGEGDAYLYRLVSMSSEGLASVIDEIELGGLDIEQFVAIAQKPIPVSDLAYRPRDYFARYDLQAELLTSVKGRARRELIKDALDTGEIDTLPDFVTTPELETLDRQMFGRMHPMFMGGEYLPKIKTKEVEIARISIQSTTYDVTVLYARQVGNRIHYRVVDEYEGDTLQEPSTRTSIKPLAMGAMIDFFITAWSLMDCLEGNFDDDVEGMLGFFTAESEFYPCFDQTLRERVQERFPRLEPEDDIEADSA